MEKSPEISLRKSIEKANSKLLMVLICLLLCLSLFAIFYISDMTLKKRVTSIGNAASMAYREKILSGDVRYSESQMRLAFALNKEDSILVLSNDFKAFYGSLNSEKAPKQSDISCLQNGSICQHTFLSAASMVFPIYHDSNKNNVAKYILVSLRPNFSLILVFGVLSLALFLFTICYFLFRRWLVQPFHGFAEEIQSWADHISRSPQTALIGGTRFSELKPLENSLNGLHLQIKELEKLATHQGKITIIRGLAHDIITPVSQLKKSIFMLCALITPDKKINKSLESVKRYMKKISNLAHQVKLLKQTDFNQIDTKQLEKVQLSTELKKLIDDMKKDDEFLRRNTDIQLIDSGEEGFIEIDPVDCQRIFQNLILNAIQSTTEDSKITIKLSSESSNPIVIVEDNGIGMDSETKSKIFDLDFTTKKAHGTGLGLSIVKLLCQKNNAKISLVSELGRGTAFKIIFQPLTLGV